MKIVGEIRYGWFEYCEQLCHRKVFREAELCEFVLQPSSVIFGKVTSFGSAFSPAINPDRLPTTTRSPSDSPSVTSASVAVLSSFFTRRSCSFPSLLSTKTEGWSPDDSAC